MLKTKNIGNQNAKKEVRKESAIQIRCTQEQKAVIVRSLRKGENLSSFMLRLAIDEADHRKAYPFNA